MSFFNNINILSLLRHYNTIINLLFLLFSFNVNFFNFTGKTGKCQCDPAFGGFACEFACPAGKKFRANEIHPSRDHMNMGRRTPIDGAVAQLDAALGACSGHGVCVTTLGGEAKCL